MDNKSFTVMQVISDHLELMTLKNLRTTKAWLKRVLGSARRESIAYRKVEARMIQLKRGAK